jgi:hypothetical protein
MITYFLVSVPVADSCGEKLAWFFGITTPKYQHAIDEYYRLKEEVGPYNEKCLVIYLCQFVVCPGAVLTELYTVADLEGGPMRPRPPFSLEVYHLILGKLKISDTNYT